MGPLSILIPTEAESLGSNWNCDMFPALALHMKRNAGMFFQGTSEAALEIPGDNIPINTNCVTTGFERKVGPPSLALGERLRHWQRKSDVGELWPYQIN
jgi:hypothetical protein